MSWFLGGPWWGGSGVLGDTANRDPPPGELPGGHQDVGQASRAVSQYHVQCGGPTCYHGQAGPQWTQVNIQTGK